jgi:hypothetical protein
MKRWNEEEINFLKENNQKGYDYLLKKINRSKKSIAHKAKKLGISVYYKNTGRANTNEKELERRMKISNAMKKNPNAGGLRKGSGRGKKGTYKGYYCDSSYELAWVIYNLDHNISFERNTEKFKYLYKGEEKYYYPDFSINNTYYEIKGYVTEQVKEKIKQFPKDEKLIVLFKDDLEDVFNYVENKYGKNYINLYDDKKELVCEKCGGYICRNNKSGLCIVCNNKSRVKSKDKSNKKNKKKNNVIKHDVCGCGNRKYHRSSL